MKNSPSECIKNEANNGLENLTSAQFFINTNDNTFLNFSAKTDEGWGYCVFGKVIEGEDTVDKIENASTAGKTRYQDVPKKFIVIENAEIIED